MVNKLKYHILHNSTIWYAKTITHDTTFKLYPSGIFNLRTGELSIPGINAYCREFGGGRMS